MRSATSEIGLSRDTNDNAPWSATDDDDLIDVVSSGASLDEAAAFLCRSGNLLDVAQRAAALRLKWQHGLLH
ncbi:MAG: hypothetical protein WCD52_07645 [Xanthobacteraceae bacterium]